MWKYKRGIMLMRMEVVFFFPCNTAIKVSYKYHTQEQQANFIFQQWEITL